VYGLGILTVAISAILPKASLAQNPGPAAKVVALDTRGSGYLPVLAGPPETVTMRSGLVELAPQHSVGQHSTEQNEEVLIVLEGKGEMLLQDGRRLPVEANHAVYCPPRTVHDVKNTGAGYCATSTLSRARSSSILRARCSMHTFF